MSRGNDALTRAPTGRAVIAALLWLGLAPRTSTQAFPSKSITIVVPYPPGGPIELLARPIAQEADLGQSIVAAPPGRIGNHRDRRGGALPR